MSRVVHWNQPGAPATGKTEPDSIQSGSSSMFMNAWKPCVDSVFHAIASPMLVIANAINPIIASDTTIAPRLRWIPASGAIARKIAPCINDSVVQPSAWPSTIVAREIGATSTPCRNPWRRSSTVDAVAKIAVNSSISTITPG